MMPPGRDATLDAVRRPAEAGAPSTGNGESGFPYYPAYPAASATIGKTPCPAQAPRQVRGALRAATGRSRAAGSGGG